MIGSELLAIFYGLASAASWGAGDFSGGFATKRIHVAMVMLISQLIGVILLVVLALLFQEQLPPLGDLLLGGVAGIAGVLALSALYSALATGQMGVVAPISAVVSGILPVMVALFLEGLPSAPQLAGFAIALLAVWLLSSAGGEMSIQRHELTLAAGAGIGFGLFFVLMDQATHHATLWPLVAARTASVIFMATFVLLRKKWQTPSKNMLPVLASSGIFDTGGNAFFVLAAQTGRLDVAAIVSSLYPAITALLAWFILKERLSQTQWIGVLAALVAIVLITA